MSAQYPYIGIYATFHDGGKWATNKPYKHPNQINKIKSRLIAWKAKNPTKVATLQLYDHPSEGINRLIFQDPRNFRLWLKYDWEQRQHAKNTDTGTSVHLIPASNPDHDSQTLYRLLFRAASEIDQQRLWQARIYGPPNELLFEWNHTQGELRPGGWLNSLNAIESAHG